MKVSKLIFSHIWWHYFSIDLEVKYIESQEEKIMNMVLNNGDFYHEPSFHIEKSLFLNFKNWHIGYFHTYYDGNHHKFSIGPIHFYWFN